MKELSGSRLFIIAIVCGLIAAGLTVLYMKQVEQKYRQAAVPKKEVMVAVVVPRKNMARGQRLTEQDIASRSVPEKYLPANVVTAEHYKSLLNRTLLSPVQRGRPITWEAVTEGSTETFSEVVDIGRRAMTIKISKVDSFDGLLRPGDIIDLMGVFSLEELGIQGGPANQRVSDDVVMPVIERVEVLEASRQDLNGTRYEKQLDRNSVDGFNMEFTMITLNLTMKQVARVQMAQETGDLFAVLRHPKDTSTVDYEYLGVSLLLTEDQPTDVDLVLDENGKPIGRVIGDNIVDQDGNVIGKVVDGKAVGFDGKPLGRVVRNVDPDDPINRVDDIADVVRDTDGNIVGRVVNGKVLDKAGNVIGRLDADGNPVGLDGRRLGTIEENVALDSDGNEVDTSSSSVATAQTRREQVVRDAAGNIVGRVIDGKVVDKNGRVIGSVDKNGRAIGLDGKRLGRTEEVLVNRDGEIAARQERIIRDGNGKVVGRVVDGKIVDADGKVIGAVGADGVARALDGSALGQVETAMVDENGKVVATVSEVLRDTDGNIIGRVVDGKVVDADGNVVGHVAEDGTVTDADGNVIGRTEKVMLDKDGRAVEEAVQVIRDANGNIIGRLENGKVVDGEGNVIGEYRDGQVVDSSGRVIAGGVSVGSESPVAVAAEIRDQQAERITRTVRVVDFIAGGTAEDGITPVRRVRVE